jgi:transposase
MSPPPGQAFVAVPIASAGPMPIPMVNGAGPAAVRMNLHSRLPNGVVVDLLQCDLHQTSVVVEALGRLRCFASTTP